MLNDNDFLKIVNFTHKELFGFWLFFNWIFFPGSVWFYNIFCIFCIVKNNVNNADLKQHYII